MMHLLDNNLNLYLFVVAIFEFNNRLKIINWTLQQIIHWHEIKNLAIK